MPIRPLTSLPADSDLCALRSSADFWDAYSAPLRDISLTPLAIAQHTFGKTPAWVNALLHLRDRLIALVGIRAVGAMTIDPSKPLAAYRVGDRLAIFNIFALSDREIVLGINDTHLDVRVALIKPADAPGTYVTATVVKTHNWLGRLYMVPVARGHPIIVRAMMRKARL